MLSELPLSAMAAGKATAAPCDMRINKTVVLVLVSRESSPEIGVSSEEEVKEGRNAGMCHVGISPS
jgi:hypothetical protein